MTDVTFTTGQHKITQITLSLEDKAYLASKHIRATHLVRQAIAEMKSHDKVSVEFDNKIQQSSMNVLNRCRADFQGELSELRAEIDNLNENVSAKLKQTGEKFAFDYERLNERQGETDDRITNMKGELDVLNNKINGLVVSAGDNYKIAISGVQNLSNKVNTLTKDQSGMKDDQREFDRKLGNMESRVAFVVDKIKERGGLGGLFRKT